MNKSFILPSKYLSRSFTLIELIVVIIIVGILAAVGISQYSDVVEKSRIAEAKIRLGAMRQLAYEYYMNNGTVAGLGNNDVGVDNTCSSTDYYRYYVWNPGAPRLWLGAVRCTAGGKTPKGSIAYEFASDDSSFPGLPVWRCRTASSSCFGYPW